ncbi:MAG: hypothetical protein JWR36_2518 [Glaciihabitans sp.]|nr:hypothetical protein [Glaciihabitans sp.]MDQ1569779.1 hypothetical protein [Actinomycetota bacterium]
MDAGYSGTPQLKKLGLVDGARWFTSDAPASWTFETEPDASLRVPEGAAADVVLAFVRSAAEIEPALERLERCIFPAGALWIAWPRKAGGHASDITDNVVRDAALRRKLVDVKVAAIDTDWSGLKLVWRKEFRT